MPDTKTNTPLEVTTAKTNVDSAKPAIVTPPKVDDAASSKTNGAKPGPDPTNVATTQSPAKRFLTMKKVIPVFVLALAAVILFGIIGGWNRWVGSGSTQKTDD